MIVLVLAVGASPAIGTVRQAREIRVLRAQVKTLKGTVERWREFATDLSEQVAAVTKERDSARFSLVAAQVDNNNLRAGLPDAIKAVPQDRFWELVFTPVREAWRCDSVYSSTEYWSVTFESAC